MVNPARCLILQRDGRFAVLPQGRDFSLAFIAAGILGALSFTFGAQTALAYDFEPSLKPGFQLIMSGQADKALEFFNQAAREKPDSADVHLGRASALRFLSRPDEALKEYRLTLQLNPSEQVARKCNEDICAMERSAADAHKVDLPQANIGKNDVEKCMSDIMRQSEERIKGIHKDAEGYATSIYKSSTAAHYKALENIKRQVEEMSYVTPRGSRITTPDAFQLQSELTARSQSRLKYARHDYELRRKEAQSKAVALKEAAEGLQSQMLQKPSDASGVYMVPNGTNLYVRNYAHFDPVVPEAPVPMQATAQKLPEIVQAENAKPQKPKTKHSKKRRAGN